MNTPERNYAPSEFQKRRYAQYPIPNAVWHHYYTPKLHHQADAEADRLHDLRCGKMSPAAERLLARVSHTAQQPPSRREAPRFSAPENHCRNRRRGRRPANGQSIVQTFMALHKAPSGAKGRWLLTPIGKFASQSAHPSREAAETFAREQRFTVFRMVTLDNTFGITRHA